MKVAFVTDTGKKQEFIVFLYKLNVMVPLMMRW